MNRGLEFAMSRTVRAEKLTTKLTSHTKFLRIHSDFVNKKQMKDASDFSYQQLIDRQDFYIFEFIAGLTKQKARQF